MGYDIYLFFFTILIFFNVSYQTFFGLFCGLNMVCFYRKNRHLLMNNTNYINTSIFYLNMILDGTILYLWLINIYLHKYETYKNIIYYSNKLNSLFLQTTSYISDRLLNYFVKLPKETTQKEYDDVNIKIKNELEATNFLEKLKKC
jgi:hypothetical protein